MKQTIGEQHLFEIKVYPNSELMVVQVFTGQQIMQSLVARQVPPTGTSPRLLLERKRTDHTDGGALLILESEKKTEG